MEKLKNAKNAYRKGIITFGEYLGLVSNVFTECEKKLFELDENVHFENHPEYVELWSMFHGN